MIVIEWRITAGSNTIVLKSHQGEKLSSNKQDLCDVINHLNYFKATLWEKVSKLLDMNVKTIQDLVKIEEKLFHAEQMDELAKEICTLQKRLVWAIVYETDKKLEDIQVFVRELKQFILLVEEDIEMQLVSSLVFYLLDV
ncbi:hypothetical protein SELMODRAFT_418738 [Selaginella moellendorffii]|uniref:Uncharacterized protein n=1 Tax=Selaginella moellendorffii TaxID=88036 RepID=D8S701_SELML|nr:hypothetical protein SELMODRAFT_418738 [Selaginella moellendorffii]